MEGGALTATLMLPAALRRHADGQTAMALAPGPLRAALDKLGDAHPMLARCLLDDTGELRGFVRVYRNGEDIRHLDGLDSVLSAGDTVQVTVAVAGG